MTARFEIVRTDAPQPWHARFRAANGRIVWTTENYTRRGGALSAIHGLARAMSPKARIWVSNTTVSGKPAGSDLRFGHHDDTYATSHLIEVRDVDERYVPPPVVLESPFYANPTAYAGDGGPFWHDRDYHWRNCYGDECTEGTPPAGTSVRGRMGSVTV